MAWLTSLNDGCTGPGTLVFFISMVTILIPDSALSISACKTSLDSMAISSRLLITSLMLLSPTTSRMAASDISIRSLRISWTLNKNLYGSFIRYCTIHGTRATFKSPVNIRATFVPSLPAKVRRRVSPVRRERNPNSSLYTRRTLTFVTFSIPDGSLKLRPG